MRHFYFICIIWAFGCHTKPARVTFADPRLEQALLALFDTGGDGEIHPQEAFAATGYLHLRNLGLTSLEGIQAFPNLTHLDAADNLLTSLPAFDVHHQLTELIVSRNQLTHLGTLQLPLLKTLACDGNRLSALPALDHLSQLETLNCNHNQLQQLPSLPGSLSTLRAAHNQLTHLGSLPGLLLTLDLAHNQLTRAPDLSLLNQLSVLDLRANPLQTMPNLDAHPSLRIKQGPGWPEPPARPTYRHVPTPSVVKAIYMSSFVAGMPALRTRLVELIDTTELNALVLDVKDNTGVLSWDGRIPDLEAFLDELHAKNIYVIGRIASFQDPLWVSANRSQAVAHHGSCLTWGDHEGVPWADTGSQQMWQYLAEVGKKAYELGFDELNYDYIRFPTDGELDQMRFPVSGTRGLHEKQAIVRSFFEFLSQTFRPECIPISGDIFGIVMTTRGDIPLLGQDLFDALLHFDYVAPMVYPSHFQAWTDGWANPAEVPGPIIDYVFRQAAPIFFEVGLHTGQSLEQIKAQLRPWYQDFHMGATYTPEMVRAQIEAGVHHGVTSWMLWDPRNRYTPAALEK